MLSGTITFSGATLNLAPAAGGAAVEPYREDRVATMENLGDLHLKQGQPQRAIEAYAKAVGLAEVQWKEWIKESDRGSADQRLNGVRLKLAQAYLAGGKADEAREALEQVHKSGEKKAEPSKNRKPTVALPARLTVSAPKRLLDQVGAGKHEFRGVPQAGDGRVRAGRQGGAGVMIADVRRRDPSRRGSALSRSPRQASGRGVTGPACRPVPEPL